MIYKISTWFRRSIGMNASDIPTSKRVAAAIKGFLKDFFSPNILTLLKVFFVDVIFQIRILKEDFLRWLMHMLIYGGFMLLLLMHASGWHHHRSPVLRVRLYPQSLYVPAGPIRVHGNRGNRHCHLPANRHESATSEDQCHGSAMPLLSWPSSCSPGFFWRGQR